jgi:hypothetical protein
LPSESVRVPLHPTHPHHPQFVLSLNFDRIVLWPVADPDFWFRGVGGGGMSNSQFTNQSKNYLTKGGGNVGTRRLRGGAERLSSFLYGQKNGFDTG